VTHRDEPAAPFSVPPPHEQERQRRDFGVDPATAYPDVDPEPMGDPRDEDQHGNGADLDADYAEAAERDASPPESLFSDEDLKSFLASAQDQEYAKIVDGMRSYLRILNAMLEAGWPAPAALNVVTHLMLHGGE
jgi:hypothetical protein